jgi:hypothetical protein
LGYNIIIESDAYIHFASLKIGKKGKNREKWKNRSIYETQEEIFWLKFSLKLLKLLFSAGKITKKKLFPTQPEKNDVKN